MALLFPLGSFCIAFLLAFGLNWLALIPWRRSVGQHWTERARLLYPVRISARMNTWLIPLCLGLLSCELARGMNFLLVGMTGFFGALLAGYFFNRKIVPSLLFSLWLRTVSAILLIYFLWFFALLFTAFEIPPNFGPMTWLAAGGVFLLLLAIIFGLGIFLSNRLRILLPATEPLKTLVAEVSEKMQVQVRATWILPSYINNAAAFPQTRQLIFTNPLLSRLSDEEIKTVCAHELGHLSESRKVRFARNLVVFAFFPLIFTRPVMALGDNNPFVGWFLAGCLFPWLILFFVIRMARRMEKRADKIATANQSDVAIYAWALARIYEANHMPAVMPRRSVKVHPDLYDRMMDAGVTPDFPKPLPPKRQSWTSFFVWGCIVFILYMAFFMKPLFATFQAQGGFSG